MEPIPLFPETSGSGSRLRQSLADLLVCSEGLEDQWFAAFRVSRVRGCAGLGFMGFSLGLIRFRT